MFSVVQFPEILLPLAPLQIVLNGWMAQNVFAKLPQYSDGMHSGLCSALREIYAVRENYNKAKTYTQPQHFYKIILAFQFNSPNVY